jgi:hypothetical protein
MRSLIFSLHCTLYREDVSSATERRLSSLLNEVADILTTLYTVQEDVSSATGRQLSSLLNEVADMLTPLYTVQEDENLATGRLLSSLLNEFADMPHYTLHCTGGRQFSNWTSAVMASQRGRWYAHYTVNRTGGRQLSNGTSAVIASQRGRWCSLHCLGGRQLASSLCQKERHIAVFSHSTLWHPMSPLLFGSQWANRKLSQGGPVHFLNMISDYLLSICRTNMQSPAKTVM